MPERSEVVRLSRLAEAGRQGEARKWYTAALSVDGEAMRRRTKNSPPPRTRPPHARLSDKAADLAPGAHRRLQLWTLTWTRTPSRALAYRALRQIHLSRGTTKSDLDFAKVTDLKPLDRQAWFDRGLLTTVSRSMPTLSLTFSKSHREGWGRPPPTPSPR